MIPQNQPLEGFQPNHPAHQFRLVLRSDTGPNSWTSTIELDTRPGSPARFLIFTLPTPVKPLAGGLQQLGHAQSEFVVRLAGEASPAQLVDLSHTHQKEWMPTMLTTFAGSQAALAILLNRGRISVVLHEGEAL